MSGAPADRVATLAVKVIPGASRAGIAGWLGEALKVRVAAPPERGKANAAVLALVAEALDLPAAAVTLAAVPTSPRKTLRIEGLSDADVRKRLG